MATSAQLLVRALRGEKLIESELLQLENSWKETERLAEYTRGWVDGNGQPADMTFKNARFLASPSRSTTFIRPTDTTIANNTPVYITFENSYGVGFRIDPTDATRILSDWSGSMVLITGAPTWANNATGYRATQLELYDGTGALITTHTLHVTAPVNGDDTKPSFAVVMNSYLYTGLYYIKVIVRQTSGGNLTLKDFFFTLSLI